MKRKLYKEGGGGGGIKKYVGRLEDITYDADNMKFYEKATGKELGDSAILDEVVVKGREPIQILVDRNPNYKQQLLDLYKSKEDKSIFRRLLNVYNAAGQPKINPLSKDSEFGSDRAYITHFNNMYVRNNAEEGFDDIIAELSHPLQEKYGNNSVKLEALNPFYSPDDFRGKTRYVFPDKFESETHKDFQPLIDYYVKENILPGQYYIEGDSTLGNDNIIENPSLKQVLDSAKVYNKRKQDLKFKYKNAKFTRTPRPYLISKLGDIF